MSILKVSDNFASGTGVGNNDAIPVGVSLYQQSSTEDEVDETMLVGSGLVLSGITEAYEERVDFYSAPGYIYLGDREFYMYSEKITQVSNAIESGTVLTIPLKDFPDGPRPVYFDDIYKPGEEELITYGPAPIVVRKHPSGILSNLQVPYDQIINSRTGISGQVGYRMEYNTNRSGTVISGEVADFPWYVSPLNRFSKCYEQWRNDDIISPEFYEYDFATNAILIHPSGNVFSSGEINSEYVTEFEGANEPFMTGLDLSPLVTYPELSIICLSPDEDSKTEEVGSVRMYTAKTRVSNETVTIATEVKSKTGNRMADTTVDLYIERPDMESDIDIPSPLEGEPLYYGPHHSYDKVKLPSAGITEAGSVISTDHRIEGEAYIRAVGYLSGIPESEESIQTVGYHLQATTDDMGVSHIYYVAPSGGVTSTIDLRIRAVAGEVETDSDISLLSSDDEYDIGSEQYGYKEWRYVSGILPQDGLAFIPIISGCVSPSSVTACKADDFSVSVSSGIDPTMALAIEFRNISEHPYVGFNIYQSGIPLVVSYPMNINATKMDGRGIYGR